MDSLLGSLGFTEWFVILVVAIVGIVYLKKFYGEVEFVRSSVDGRSYLVRMLPDRQEAADILARLNAKMTRLIQHMVAKYPNDAGVAQLHKNYNPDALSEGGAEVGYTSYSVNKGERIVMCVRQTDGTFVDENVLFYVATHELAHLMTHEIGHTELFWNNFKMLLSDAVSINLYKDVNFAQDPQPYCGISISSSILGDGSSSGNKGDKGGNKGNKGQQAA